MVVIALIDGVYYVDIADAVTEVIDKRGVNAKDETITCGDNVYGQSGIYYENIMYSDILDAETEVSYDLYLDHFGFVRLYTESAYNNGFVLLLDGYYKTDRRDDDFKAQIWNTEDGKAEDVEVANSKAFPAAMFIDTAEGGDNGNRGTWYRLNEADLTYVNVESTGIVTNIAAYMADEDGEYSLAHVEDGIVSNKKDYNVEELALTSKTSVKDRTLNSMVRHEMDIQATTTTQYYFVVRGNGINKNVEAVYSWVGYKNAPAEAVLYGETYAYAVTSEGAGDYRIAEVVVFESDAAVSNALNFVYAVDNKTLAKADEAQVIGYDAETEKYAADLWRDVDDADLDALINFYKIFSDESVAKITKGSYNKNNIYAGPAELALDVTSRDYQKVIVDRDSKFYFAPAETPCYIVNYNKDGNARTMYSVEEQNYRFEIDDELIFVTDNKGNVQYVINATQSTWMDGKVEKDVAALTALYNDIMDEQGAETVVDNSELLYKVAFNGNEYLIPTEANVYDYTLRIKSSEATYTAGTPVFTATALYNKSDVKVWHMTGTTAVGTGTGSADDKVKTTNITATSEWKVIVDGVEFTVSVEFQSNDAGASYKDVELEAADQVIQISKNTVTKDDIVPAEGATVVSVMGGDAITTDATGTEVTIVVEAEDGTRATYTVNFVYVP